MKPTWACGDQLDYFAVRTAVGKEKPVQNILIDRGVLVEFPVREYPSKSRYVSNPPPVVRPAYPGFVFIAFEKRPKLEDYPWCVLDGVHMIYGPVGIRKRPVRLDHKGLIRLFEEIIFSDAIAPKRPEYKKDDMVKIVEGSFAGFPAMVVEAGETELRLLTHIFGRETPVSIPKNRLDWIEMVKAAA